MNPSKPAVIETNNPGTGRPAPGGGPVTDKGRQFEKTQPGPADPNHSGPTPGPSTGQKPPGWHLEFDRILDAYLANPYYAGQGITDDAILDLAAKLTDSKMARYPASH